MSASGGSSAPLYATMFTSGVSAIGTGVAQSRAISAQGDYEESVANTNAKLAQLQGKQAISAGDAEAARREEQSKLQVGAARAATAAGGSDVSGATATRTINATQEIGAADELTIKNNAARTAWGFQTQAVMDTFKGQFAQLTAKAQSNQTLITGGLKAVGGPMGIYGNFLRYQQRYEGHQSSPDTSGGSDTESEWEGMV